MIKYFSITNRAAYPPAPEQLDNEEISIALVQQLRDEVQVGDQGRLQNDRHVGGVEQLDGVLLLLAPPLLAADGQVHPEPLQRPTKVMPPCRSKRYEMQSPLCRASGMKTSYARSGSEQCRKQ